MSGQDLTSATEGPTPEPVASDVVAPARARRRAPRKDEVLMGAVDEARAGLAGLATPEQIGEHLYTGGQADPDLVIRTSGEQRLSGFLLWQAAYSEIWFTDTYWPAFRKIDFLRALREYSQRSRRFGK